MKGKGRDREHERKDSPIQLTDFSVADDSATCSKYSAILQKKEEGCITVEDLDPLQFDLECLLVAVTKRRHDLEKEMQLLSSLRNRKSLANFKQEPKSNGKRSCVSEGKPTTKKCKDNSGKSHTPQRQKAKAAQYNNIETPIEPPKPKSDTPNRFWASIEPYFADLTQDHIRFLEDEINSYEHDTEYYEVPAHGRHYGYKWSIKEIQEEQKEGEKVAEKLKGTGNAASYTLGDAEKLLKKFEKENEAQDKSTYGPLTTCIINCLVEENIISVEDNIESGREKGTSSSGGKRPKMCLRSLKTASYVEVEKKLQKTLEDIGLLTFDESERENPEDEVFMELRNLQQTLKALSEHNKQQKIKLLETARHEMARQTLRKQLQVVDAEIKECQKKWVTQKRKKKAISNIDRDQIQKVLQKRQDLIRNLESKGIQLI